MKRGDLVYQLQDDVPYYGRVTSAGRANYSVTWESGRQSRVAQGYPAVRLVEESRRVAAEQSLERLKDLR